jgi:hypothetical protein
MGLVVGMLLSFGAMGAASAASNLAPSPAPQEAIEEIIITAKRVAPPEVIEEIVIIAKRPARSPEARTPPVMPIVLPSLEFAVAAPPTVRL